jgi:hypothetical protein
MYLKNTQPRGLRTQRTIDTSLVEKVNIGLQDPVLAGP